MYVTSDIYDLAEVARWSQREWREQLVCTVAVHGPVWPGAAAAADFLVRSADACRVFEKMKYGGYDRLGEFRTRPIRPTTLRKVARGEFANSNDVRGVLLHSEGGPFEGGQACEWSDRRDDRSLEKLNPFVATFSVALDDNWVARSEEVMRFANDTLKAEYAYTFVCDESRFPEGFAWGISPGPIAGQLLESDAEKDEINQWYRYQGQAWTTGPCLLRDLFQVNLLGPRLLGADRPKIGKLERWIRTDRGRGVLSEAGSDRLIWTLTDEQMIRVRPELIGAGALFGARERRYRDIGSIGPLVQRH